MRIQDLVIEVRDVNFARVGQLRPENLVDFTAVLLSNAVGSWVATLPVGDPMAEELQKPGAGIIVTLDGKILISGPTTSVVTDYSQENPSGSHEISGVDDLILLTERLAYPTPATADLSAQTNAFDVRTGPAETVMKAYVEANIGSSAPAARKITTLTVEASAGLGPTLTGSARFETLQELLTGLAALSGLGFTIKQDTTGVIFYVYQPVDRSAYIRLDIDNNRLIKSVLGFSAPKITRAIVGGKGDGTARTLIERTSSASLAAESLWVRRIEKFVNESSADTLDELQQSGDKELAADGKTFVSADVMPTDSQTMIFGTDWNLGDLVTVVVGEFELVAVVEKVALTIGEDGVYLAATVGDPRGLGYESQLFDSQKDQEFRVSKLERN